MLTIAQKKQLGNKWYFCVESLIKEIVNNILLIYAFYIFYSSRNRKKSSTVNHHLSVAVVNSLWSILTGEKIAHGDERVRVNR